MKKETNHNNNIKNPPNNNGGIFYFTKWLTVCLGLFFVNTINAQAIAMVDKPKQSFEKVMKGEVVHLNYVITNVGNEPLLLQKYDVECSCTSATYDAAPILPGNSATVTVNFDTKTVYERQDRTVLLHSNNSKGDIKLRFKGYVKSK